MNRNRRGSGPAEAIGRQRRAGLGTARSNWADAALNYTIVEEIPGPEWLTTDLFRIGASSAANNLLSAIEGHTVKYF